LHAATTIAAAIPVSTARQSNWLNVGFVLMLGLLMVAGSESRRKTGDSPTSLTLSRERRCGARRLLRLVGWRRAPSRAYRWTSQYHGLLPAGIATSITTNPLRPIS